MASSAGGVCHRDPPASQRERDIFFQSRVVIPESVVAAGDVQ
jgi:hypothetical protein